MGLVKVDWNPDTKFLRNFSLLLLCFGVLVGVYFHFRYTSAVVGTTFSVIAALVGVIGTYSPKTIRPVYIGWMTIAFPIGWCVSHLILAAVFFLVVTPIGLIMKVVRYDPLQHRIDRQADSYWILRQASGDLKRYFRQY